MRAALSGALILLVLAAPAVAARRPTARTAAQSATQRFFAGRLVEDDKTSKEIRGLLSAGGGGFVDRAVKFRDLTGDGKADAVVGVQSGGVAGAVALYVFSTDNGRGNGPLRVVFRSQSLLRAQTRIRDGVLRYRTARPAPGDEPCCPSREAESRLRWREARHRFEVVERRSVAPADLWGDQPAPSPSPARAG